MRGKILPRMSNSIRNQLSLRSGTIMAREF